MRRQFFIALPFVLQPMMSGEVKRGKALLREQLMLDSCVHGHRHETQSI
jgi:hypothetical protein